MSNLMKARASLKRADRESLSRYVYEKTSLSRRRGSPLPEDLRRRAEALFGEDFSDVRVFVSRAASRIGAIAFTSGSEIHMAPGAYDPCSPAGVRLLGHELTHVVQQRRRRVQNSYGYGVAVVLDPVLEVEADNMGQALQRSVTVPTAAHHYTVSARQGEGIVMQQMQSKNAPQADENKIEWVRLFRGTNTHAETVAIMDKKTAGGFNQISFDKLSESYPITKDMEKKQIGSEGEYLPFSEEKSKEFFNKSEPPGERVEYTLIPEVAWGFGRTRGGVVFITMPSNQVPLVEGKPQFLKPQNNESGVLLYRAQPIPPYIEHIKPEKL